MVTKQKILKEIRDRLFSITKSNGYYNDIRKVEVARQEQFQSNDVPAINVTWRGDSPAVQNFGSGERTMTILIGGFTTSNEKDLDAAEISFQLEEDIIIALNRNLNAPMKTDQKDPYLGGLIKEISEHDAASINKGRHSPYIGVLIEFDVRYLLDGETLT